MKIKIVCSECGKETEKDHWNVVEGKTKFCNRKCANQRLNSIRWKGHIPLRDLYKCELCGKPRDHRNKGKLCQSCCNNESRIKNNKITIGELKQKHKNKEIYWYSAEIRNYCKMYNSSLQNHCQFCGYDKHVELCHIKPINSFDDNATIGEINNPNNLLVLCPNHHWEFDNGLLTLTEIGRRGGI